jgi:hypothetical protein
VVAAVGVRKVRRRRTRSLHLPLAHALPAPDSLLSEEEQKQPAGHNVDFQAGVVRQRVESRIPDDVGPFNRLNSSVVCPTEIRETTSYDFFLARTVAR